MGKEIKKDILASRLLDVMEKRNVRQRELANHIGVNYQGLNRRINQSRLTPAELNMICADLDCDVDYILGTTDENAGFMRISKSYEQPDRKTGEWLHDLLQDAIDANEITETQAIGIMWRAQHKGEKD